MAQASHNRPLSPHLSVYRWQITNTLSILHRLTGFGLALGLVPLSLWLWGAAYDPALFEQLQHAAISPLGLVFLAGWSLAFYYHFGNGLRHLNWDIGNGFSLGEVTSSGILVVIFAFSMTSLTWVIIARKLGWL